MRRGAILGYFSFFCLGYDWAPLSALGTAPVKTHTSTHTWSGGGLIAASEKASAKHSNGCNDEEQSCAVTLKAQVNYLLQSYIQPHMTERHTILAII